VKARWPEILAATVVILVCSTVLVGLFSRAFRTLSPIDEAVHLDALARALDGEVVRRGDRIGQEAMRAAACRKVQLSGLMLPPCRAGETYDANAFPAAGYNNADIHPPTYYFVTAVATRLFMWAGVDDLVTAGRLTGGLWLGAGLVVMWFGAGRLGMPRLHRVILVALLVTAPSLIHSSGTVNPDASALLAGGLMVLAVVQWEDRRWPLWPAVLISFIGPLFKSSNALAVGACAIYLLLGVRRATLDRHGPDRRLRLGAAVLLLGAGTISVLGWASVHEAIARAPTTPVIEFFERPDAGLDELVNQGMGLVTPLRPDFMPAVLDAGPIRVFAGLTEMVLIVAAFGPVLYLARPGRAASLGISGGIAMLAGGFLLGLAYLLLLGISFDLPARYGLSLIPLIGISLGSALSSRVSLWVVGVLAAASLLVTVVLLVLGE
jgi:hypothetical protein